MIVLFGENTYERDRTLRKLTRDFEGEVVIRNGDEITLADMPDLLMGQTLFSEKRMVILKRLSENTDLWQKLEGWYARISSDTTLVIVEDKPDKRTVAWKFLQKNADTREFTSWTNKQAPEAVEWLLVEAKHKGISMKDTEARYLVERVGVEQYELADVLEKLALAGKTDKTTIALIAGERIEETAFGLLELSLNGNVEGLHKTLSSLKQTEEPYRVMALIASQLVQLAAVRSSGGKTTAELARDIGTAPFIVSRLQRLSGNYSSHYTKLAADTDYAMKTTSAQPWELVEHLLLEIATS